MWNLVLLCRSDHDWLHAHPEIARSQGFIISAYMDVNEARAVPLMNWKGTARVFG